MKFYDTDTHEIFEASASEIAQYTSLYRKRMAQDAPRIWVPECIPLKGHYHWIYKLDEEYVMIKFEDKYVHFRWDDSLKDKKVFYADSIDRLEADVAEGKDIEVLIGASENGDCPFRVKAKQGVSTTVWRFVYYDPNYDCKVAFNEGKTIQCRNHLTDEWRDISRPVWEDETEYRIKPSKPALQWTDLKIGDVIKSTNRKATVVAIVTDEDAFRHVCVGCRWLTNDELELWEKVEE